MWPFILIGLLIYLILIVISVCAYPFICASIASACKRFNQIATCFLLLLTIAIYILACTTLEYSFDNWCYSVYAGIVLTPFFLFVSTGLEVPGKWLESGDKPQHGKITIPILTFFTSLLFAIEGVLRMAHSNSIHKLLNYGFISSDSDSYLFYYDEFKYAGSLLFFVSLVSALIIGFISFSNYKETRRKLALETEKKTRIEGEINMINQRLKEESDLLASIESKQVGEVILCYNSFCENIVSALESSDEKSNFSFEYSSFNNINTSYKVLLLSNRNKGRSYYFYPMGIVAKNSNDIYKYIPIGSTTVSLKREQKNKQSALPNDVRPIRQFWLHTCRDGSPDLRYNYNPKTYIYEYSILSIGELILNVYRTSTAKDVVNSYNELFSCISRIKVQKSNNKTNEDIKTAASDMISGNRVVTPKCEPSEEVKFSRQHTIETPKTIEECFSDIILKRGKDALADNNIANIISLSYKDVDIKEYKDVLDRMARDKFLYQFFESNKQKDFVLYNITSSYARRNKIDVQKSLFIIQALVAAIKKI